MPTPPKSATATTDSGSVATAARPHANSTTAAAVTPQAALEFVSQLRGTVDQLERELKSYANANVIGRDTILLRSFCDQITGRLMQISAAYRLGWSPPSAGRK